MKIKFLVAVFATPSVPAYVAFKTIETDMPAPSKEMLVSVDDVVSFRAAEVEINYAKNTVMVSGDIILPDDGRRLDEFKNQMKNRDWKCSVL